MDDCVKEYFVATDRTFQQVVEWISTQLSSRNLAITGYREIQLKKPICGNKDEEHEWDNVYNFSRTAHATMRHLMLTVTELVRFHDPGSSQPSKKRNAGAIRMNQAPTGFSTEINHGYHLASSPYEARRLSAHFDMLFPHYHMQNWLDGIDVGQPCRSRRDQLVVVDYHNNDVHVVWLMIVTLSVRMESCNHEGMMRFNADPYLVVYRMEPPTEQPLRYLFPKPDLDEDAKKVTELEKKIEGLTLGDKQ